MSLDSDAIKRLPLEGNTVKCKIKDQIEPQADSEQENSHMQELATVSEDTTMAMASPKAGDGKPSDARERTTQNQMTNRASNANAQGQPPQINKKVENMNKQGLGQGKASKNKVKGKRQKGDQIFEAAMVDMKVNKFIKSIKTGVKSGVDTAVKVGM